MASDMIYSLTVKQLKTGAYVSSAIGSASGYITIKSEEGTDRKLLVA